MTQAIRPPASPPSDALPPRAGGRTALALNAMALLLLAAIGLRLLVGAERVGLPQGRLSHSLANLVIYHPAAEICQSLGRFAPESLARQLNDAAEYLAPIEKSTPLDFRLRRAAVAIVVGIALAISGVALQALLRNPLAEPFILGLSTGAGVGILAQTAIAYALGSQQFGASLSGAVIGAGGAMLIVLAVSRRHGMIDPLGLLLVGVVLSTVNGALIALVNSLLGPAGVMQHLSRWMLGYLSETVSDGTVTLVGVITIAGVVVAFRSSRSMDVASFSDAEAMSIGVNVARLRLTLFVLASALTAASVAIAGPVSFVGLICPHIARTILGPSHRALLIASALLGASLILLADALSALLDLWWGIGILPVGVFTAMLGGPAFLWMLRPQLGRGTE